ncbi:McrB family protein [Neobacillus niacini]|uniref:McrB family protein n=1 Tax=Neobacillus niacini TaxID=86668 RepID=UPI0007ABA15D
MVKEKASWSKDNTPNLIGRKKVDWSIVEHGSTAIPQEFHQDFYNANNGLRIESGKREEVRLLINNKIYKAHLRNADRKVQSDTILLEFAKDLKEYIKEVFHSSYDYFLENGRKNIPENLAEFIEFYETSEPNKYRVNLITYRNKVEKLNDLELTSHIHDYIKSKGFYYEKDEVINLYLSLKTKPFVILSGISGTGKTMMVKWFAESLGATKENSQFNLIPVRPDWSDGSDLLGYRDIKGDFIPGPLTKVIKQATENPNDPYFVLLDEMNLARVEYYFSDFLSVIESREWLDGRLVTHPVLPEEIMGEKLGIPENVFIIGTVNMDETTHPFSKKVLDRANTIEFNRVELNNFSFLEEQEEIESLKINTSQLRVQYIHLKDAYQTNKNLVHQVTDELLKVNTVLERIGAHVGYRVRDEICFYMMYNTNGQLMDFKEALDYQLLQKILPRLSGSDYRLFSVLKDLYTYCTNKEVKDDQLGVLYEEIKGSRYPRSAQKIADMLRRYQDDGFTSFWIGG